MSAALSNRLLSFLLPEICRALRTKLEGVPLPVGTPLFETGTVPKFAYFVTSGIASVVADRKVAARLKWGSSDARRCRVASNFLVARVGRRAASCR